MVFVSKYSKVGKFEKTQGITMGYRLLWLLVMLSGISFSVSSTETEPKKYTIETQDNQEVKVSKGFIDSSKTLTNLIEEFPEIKRYL